MTTPGLSHARNRKFDAVLCDIDNVIRFYDHTELVRLERAAGLAPGATAAVAFADGVDGPLLRGEITKREWTAQIARGLAGEVPGEVADGLARAFANSPTRADEAVVDLLRRAQRHVPVVLVTNATNELDEELDRLGLLTYFGDRIVNSARVGMVKPDRRIYALAADMAGVRADRCLFVDDRPENVEAATALGMAGVRFRTPEDLAGVLVCLPDGEPV
ncbi:hypothetical protein N566_18875 [Streptomycetaceae bacterium MP113-05]|nr:hypothetical protein N566_18875 [Streptomycetaceae bacterium MP113-05]